MDPVTQIPWKISDELRQQWSVIAPSNINTNTHHPGGYTSKDVGFALHEAHRPSSVSSTPVFSKGTKRTSTKAAASSTAAAPVVPRHTSARVAPDPVSIQSTGSTANSMSRQQVEGIRTIQIHRRTQEVHSQLMGEISTSSIPLSSASSTSMVNGGESHSRMPSRRVSGPMEPESTSMSMFFHSAASATPLRSVHLSTMPSHHNAQPPATTHTAVTSSSNACTELTLHSCHAFQAPPVTVVEEDDEALKVDSLATPAPTRRGAKQQMPTPATGVVTPPTSSHATGDVCDALLNHGSPASSTIVSGSPPSMQPVSCSRVRPDLVVQIHTDTSPVASASGTATGVSNGLVYFLSAGVTVFWIRKQQHNARQGMEGAAMHVIFPIYLPFLWCSSLSDLLVGLVILFCNIHFRQSNPWDSAVIVAVAFALQHFVIEGTAFVLMQYGCGWQAVKNAAWWAAGWAIASFFVQFMLYYDGDTQVSFFANLFWNLLQLAFYGTLWFAPETKLFRRGAVIYYSRFWTILRLSVIVQDVLYRYGTTDTEIAAANCIYAVMVLPVFIMFKPIVVYKSLLYDSVWWQGLQAGSVLDSIAMSVTPTSSTRAPGGVSRRASAKNDAWWGARLYAAVFGETVVALTEQSLISRSQSASSKHSSGLSGLLGSSQHSVSSSHFSYRIVSDQDAADGAGGASGLGGGGDEESNERSSSNSYLQDDSAQSAALLVEQQQLRSPLMGMEVGFSEAQALAKEVDAIRREGTVRLLNFAYLTVDRQNATTVDKNPLHSGGGSGHAGSGGTSSGFTAAAAAVAAGAGAGAGAGGPTLPSVGAVSGLLGAGSFSRVYAGWYKHHRVAIKMLFTQDLNPDVIRRYSNEARILSELSDHPNVVKIYGVAVLPPSVCIVLEICEFGSLSDVLRGSTSAIAPRAPLLLTMADRMFLALGCARGLAALHAYAPDLCHRDIKSMNFLIDRHLNAKIADLDLGVEYARRYEEKKRSAFGGQPQHHYRSLTSFLLGRSAQKPRQNHPLYPPTRHTHRQLSSGGGGGGAMTSSHGGFQYSKKFGRSHGMNITWQAPEVLLGLSYSQKSDVYSLGLVLWEIIAAGRSNEICERVVQGFRPSIAPFLPSQPPAHASQSHRHSHTHTRNGAMLVDPHYLDVLQRCWDMDVHARPTARAVEDALHATWFQSVHRVLRTTAHVVDRSVVAQEHAKISREFAEHQQLLQQRATAAAAANPNASAAKRLKLPRTRLSPPSPALMTALDVLRHELRWHDLDTDYDSPSQLWNQSEGCYLVVTPTYPPTTTAPSSFFAQSIASGLTEFRRFFSPSSATSFAASGDTATMAAMGPAPFHCVVWATRKWLHRMGFLMHDVLGLDLLQACRSHHTDEAALRLMLQEASDPATARTKSHHLVTRLCRRDGREVTLSLHAFPVFQRPTATDAAAAPHTAAPAAAAAAAPAPAPTTTTSTKTATMPRGGSGVVLASQAPLLSMDLSLNSIEEDDTLSSCSARSSISSRGTAVAPSATTTAATAAAAMAMAMAATSAPASRPSSKPGTVWRDVPSVPATPAIGATPAGSSATAQQRSTSIGGLSATWMSQLTTSAAMSPPMGSLLGGGASQAEVEVVDTSSSSSHVSPPPVAASTSDEDGSEDARLLQPVDEDGAAVRASSTASSLPSLPSPITSPAASRRPAPTVASSSSASATAPRGPVGSTGGGGGGKTPGAAATGSMSHKAATTSFSTNATPQVAYLVLQFSMILGDPNKALHPST
eukprot:gene5995-4305_t